MPSLGVTEFFLTKFKEVKFQSFFATRWPVHQLQSLSRSSTVWMNTEIVLQILQVIVWRQPKVTKKLCMRKPRKGTYFNWNINKYNQFDDSITSFFRNINHTKEVMNTKVFANVCLVLQNKSYYSGSKCNAWAELSNAKEIWKDSSCVDIEIKFQRKKFNSVSTERKQTDHKHKNAKVRQQITVC